MFSLINLVINFFTNNTPKVNSLECTSMINQKCMPRPKIIAVNTNEPIFYLYSIKINKCIGTCNIINNPYGKIWITDIIKKKNVKVFNLISRINETK